MLAKLALLLISPALACDSLVALPSSTNTGAAIYAKNADRNGTEIQPIAFEPRRKHAPGSTIELPSGLVIPQVSETYATMGSRPYWGWGYSMGTNEYGVSIGNEYFPCHAPKTNQSALLEFPDIDRLVLERSKSAAEAVKTMTELISHYGQGECNTCPILANYNNLFMIVDTREAYIAMSSGFEWAYKKVTGDFDTLSNTYFTGADHESPGARQWAKAHGIWDGESDFDFGRVYGTSNPDGVERHARSQELIRRLRDSGKKLSKEHLMHVLSDHGEVGEGDFVDDPIWGGVRGIDTHDEMPGDDHITASTLVTDWPQDTSKRLPMVWHSLVNPCMSIFYPVFFEGSIPEWLLSNEPWRSVKHVTYGLAREDLSKIRAVKDAWRPLQQELLHRAELVATAAAGQGSAERAASLTAFMANVSESIRMTLSHLNSTLADDSSLVMTLV